MQTHYWFTLDPAIPNRNLPVYRPGEPKFAGLEGKCGPSLIEAKDINSQILSQTRIACFNAKQYRSHFKVREAPMIKTIQRLKGEFLAEGSISSQSSGKKSEKTSRSEVSIRKVAEHVGEVLRPRKCR